MVNDEDSSTDHWYCWKSDSTDSSEAWVLFISAVLTVLVVCVCIAPQRVVQLTCMRSLQVDIWYRRFALASFICAVLLSLCALIAHSLEVAIVASPQWFSLHTEKRDSHRCCTDSVCKNLRRVMIDLFAAIIPLWLLFKLSVTAVFVRRLILSFRKTMYAVTRRESMMINGIFLLMSFGLVLLIYVSSRFIISDRLTKKSDDHYFYNDKNQEGWMIFLAFIVIDCIMTTIVMFIFNRRLFQILYHKTMKEDEQLIAELTSGINDEKKEGRKNEDSYTHQSQYNNSNNNSLEMDTSELTFSGFETSSQRDLIFYNKKDRSADFLEKPDKSERQMSEMSDFSVNRFSTNARDSVVDRNRYNIVDSDDDSDNDEAGSRKKSSVGIGLVIGNRSASKHKGNLTPTPRGSRMSAFSGAFGRGRRSSLSDIKLSQKQQKMLRIATQHSVLLFVVFFSFLLNELMIGWILMKKTDFDDRGSKNVTLIALSTLITVICLHLNSSSVIRLSNRFELSLISSGPSADGLSINDASPGHTLLSNYEHRNCLSDFFLDCCHNVCVDSFECCACYCATDSMHRYNANNWCKYHKWCLLCDKCFGVMCLFCVNKYIRNKIRLEKRKQVKLLKRKRLTTQAPSTDPSNYQML